MENNNVSRVVVALKDAMAKAGHDFNAIKVLACDIDRTWGDRTGYVVTGPDDVAKRAAEFIAKWYQKNFKHDYNAQLIGSYHGVGTVHVQRGVLEHNGIEAKNIGSDPITGHIVATVYYPSAD